MSISAGVVLLVAIIVGLMTGVTAGLVVPHLVERSRRRRSRCERQASLLQKWLAARLTLSRATKDYLDAFSFVTRHAGASLPNDTAARVDEARATWLAALRQWETATAQLVVWSDDAGLGATLRRMEQPDALAVRAAVGKGRDEAQRLHVQLDALDALALEFGERFMRERPSWWSRGWTRSEGFVERMARRWR